MLVDLAGFGCLVPSSVVLVGIMRLEVLGNGFISYASNDIPLPVSLAHTLLAIFL